MTQLPEIAFLDEPRTESELKNQFFGSIVGILSEMLGGAPVSKLFIASNAVVPTAASHTIDTEGGASSGELATVGVANHPEGRILTLSCADNSRAVTIKHSMGGSGQVILHDYKDLTLNDSRDRLFLQRVGSYWEELFRAGPSFKEEPLDPDIVVAPGGVLPALDGSQLIRLPHQEQPDWIIQSIMRNTMARLACEGKSLFGLENMMVDEFIDEMGLDTAACVGQTYINGMYTSISFNDVDAIGPSYGTLSWSAQRNTGNSAAQNARDNILTGDNIWRPDSTSAWWQLDFGEVAKQFWKFGMTGTSYENDSRYTTNYIKFQYWDGTVWQDATGGEISNPNLANGQTETWVLDDVTPPTTRIRYTISGGSIDTRAQDFHAYEAVTQDMELVSISQIASSSPDAATILIRCETDGAIGVDFKAFVSRDGGTTWTEGVLEKIQEEGVVDYYEAFVDLSGQPSGTNVKYKVSSHNSKSLSVHAVGVSW